MLYILGAHLWGTKKILADFVIYDQLNHASLTENHRSMYS